MAYRKTAERMVAYRLGELPDAERDKEQELLPAGPRISLSEASRLCLPNGTLFCEASKKQLIQWFEHLFRRAGVSRDVLDEIVTGLDLSDFDARWWAINEILEVGRVREVYMGKPHSLPAYQQSGSRLTRSALDSIIQSYGLRLSISRKDDGSTQVYAQRSVEPRIKVYVCTLAMIERGVVTEEWVREKLEGRGLSVVTQQEERAA